MIEQIRQLILEYKHRIRDAYKFYSQDLINHLFQHPYTKIDFVMDALEVSRPTATSYLKALVQGGFITKHRMGKNNYYVNEPLIEILTREVYLVSEA